MPTTTDIPTSRRKRAPRPEPASEAPDGRPAGSLGRLAARLPGLGVAALIVFAAVAHGAVELWPRTAVHLALAASATAWAVASIRRRGELALPRSPTDLPVLAFFAVAGISAAFSLCPHPSWAELARLAGCAALFWLATLAFRRRSALTAAAWSLALFGGAFATLGLSVYGPRLFGFRTFEHPSDRLSLTFANPNHFAALLAMLACLTLGLAAAERGARRVLLLLCALYLETAVFFTASRAGIAALAVALAILLGGLVVAGRRRLLAPFLAPVALVAAAAAVLGPGVPLERLETLRQPLAAAGGRWQIWEATAKLVAERPWTGTGLGTYAQAIGAHQPPRLTDRFLQHAHNDYLELAAEAGLPALAAALVALAVFIAGVVRGLGRAGVRRRAIGLGAFAGCSGLLLHSTVEFNLHVPAIAWAFAALAAISLAAAPRRRLRVRLRSPGARWAAAAAVVAASSLAAAAVAAPYLAAREQGRARQLAKDRRFDAARERLRPAAEWPLSDPAIDAELASVELAAALHSDDDADRRSSLERALEHYREACRACPIHGPYHGQLAAAAHLLGRFDEAEQAFRRAVELEPKKAAAHFQLAGFLLDRGRDGEAAAAYREVLALDPRLAEPVFDRLSGAGWSTDRVRSAFPADAEARTALAQILSLRSQGAVAIAELRRAYELDPTPVRASRHLESLFDAGEAGAARRFADAYRRAFPADRNLIRQTIAILRRDGSDAESEALYRRLIDLDPAAPRPYASLATLLCHEGRYEDALAVFDQGEAAAPGDAELRYRRGLCCRRSGRHHSALEALMQASAMAPAEKLYRFHLGEQLRLLGLPERAAVELEACLDLDPEFGRCRTALARLGS